MCTCINLKTKDFYFGRTLDLEYRFEEKIVITPREYPFQLQNGDFFKTKYAIIGMAYVNNNYPMYADATNEFGLSIAGLRFTDCHYQTEIKEDKLNLTPYELIPWLLGKYKKVSEIKEDISRLNLVEIKLQEELPVTKLHFMVSDSEETVVLEQTEDGFKYYDNPIGVLTNNPPFSYQLTNVGCYLNLMAGSAYNRFSSSIDFTPYGQGLGAIGLPGDNSSCSRFVRAAFNKLNSKCQEDESSSVAQFFHILDSVSMVEGTVETFNEEYNCTLYSCCMNTTKGIYYYKTYSNNQIVAIRLTKENINASTLTIYSPIEEQQILFLN